MESKWLFFPKKFKNCPTTKSFISISPVCETLDALTAIFLVVASIQSKNIKCCYWDMMYEINEMMTMLLQHNLSCASLLSTSPDWDNFLHKKSFWYTRVLSAKSWLRASRFQFDVNLKRHLSQGSKWRQTHLPFLFPLLLLTVIGRQQTSNQDFVKWREASDPKIILFAWKISQLGSVLRNVVQLLRITDGGVEAGQLL